MYIRFQCVVLYIVNQLLHTVSMCCRSSGIKHEYAIAPVWTICCTTQTHLQNVYQFIFVCVFQTPHSHLTVTAHSWQQRFCDQILKYFFTIICCHSHTLITGKQQRQALWNTSLHVIGVLKGFFDEGCKGMNFLHTYYKKKKKMEECKYFGAGTAAFENLHSLRSHSTKY